MQHSDIMHSKFCEKGMKRINYLFLNIPIHHSLHFCISLMINGVIAIIIMIYSLTTETFDYKWLGLTIKCIIKG